MVSPVVSVIVPVYNAEKYVAACVQSLLNQTLKAIEIIVVDDGSTDKSPAVLQELSATDERILFIRQENKGVSAARNAGLARARGQFIGFADADDMAEPEMFETLYARAIADQSDWVVCNVQVIKENQAPETRLKLSNEVLAIPGNRVTIITQLMRFVYDNANWNKLYAGTVIRNNRLAFNESMQVWEDLLFNLQYVLYATQLSVVAAPLYQYRIHAASVMNQASFPYIAHFNLLYQTYSRYLSGREAGALPAVFAHEISRQAYYQLIDRIARQSAAASQSFIDFFRQFQAALKKIDPGVFSFDGAALKGPGGLKKRLLKNQQYFLFSLLVCSKRWVHR